jgi:hypothetical protein
MPWCPTCDRFWSPSTVQADGTCPQCGRAVDAGHAHPADPEQPSGRGRGTPDRSERDHEEELPPLPWHFKALAGAIALYLGFRAFQGIDWLIQHL